jgi:ubiquinone/menaquinone biosynthesis C-methylase UbiE
MLRKTEKKLKKAKVLDRAELHLGDAKSLPFKDNFFDKVFTSFTLEIFDSPEIPEVLKEIKRVLKPTGKLGIISYSKAGRNRKAVKIYEWFHRKIPKYINCRPIYLEQSVKNAEFKIIDVKKTTIYRLPIDIVIAEK